MITTRLFLRSPKDKKSAIYFEARKGDEKIRLSTDIMIPTQYWDTTTRSIKQSCPNAFLLSQKLISFSAIVAKEILIAVSW